METYKRKPAWEVALLFPDQGAWSEEEYLGLETNHLVEFSNGSIEVLPMPTLSHQLIVMFLYRALDRFVQKHQLGIVLVAPLPVRLWKAKYREPDVFFLLARHMSLLKEEYSTRADLVMEVVIGSAEDRRRDLVTKKREYAKAKVSEYWIIDPQKELIRVLRLAGKKYLVHGEFSKGEVAISHLLPGFSADVTEVFSRPTISTKATKTRRT
jgi:Uma2 family endonuclease